MRKQKLVLLCILLMATAFAASSASISTGVAPWTVNSNPAVVESPIPGSWIPNFGDGFWVGTTSSDGVTAPAGVYTFQLSIGSLIGGAGSLTVNWASDNSIVWGISNGTLAGTTSCAVENCFQAPGAPRSMTGTFAGNSVLTGTVTNAGQSASPMGLLVVGTAINSDIPEPSTIVTFGLGAAAIALSRFRRK